MQAVPPIVVRLAARRGTGKVCAALSHTEVAIAAGLPLSRVIAISQMFSWHAVTLGEAESFCTACRFDPTLNQDRNRQLSYVNLCQRKYPGLPPYYLSHSPYWRTEFLPLIQRLKSRMNSLPDLKRQPSPTEKCAA